MLNIKGLCVLVRSKTQIMKTDNLNKFYTCWAWDGWALGEVQAALGLFMFDSFHVFHEIT